MWYKGKEVTALSSWRINSYTPGTRDLSTFYEYWHRDKDGIVVDSDEIEPILTKRVYTLKPGSTLLFDKNSNFPRMKLQGTDFKRCIKANKATAYVVNTFIPTDYEKVNCIIVDIAGVSVYAKTSWFSDGYDNFFSKFGKPYKVHEIEAFVRTGHEYDWLQNYLENQLTLPIITDGDLNKQVFKNCDELTPEIINSAISMIRSTDPTTMKLGFEALGNYDVTKYKGTLKFLLCQNTRWAYHASQFGVNIQNTLKELHCTKNELTRMDYIITDILESGLGPEDYKMFKEMAQPVVENLLEQSVGKYNLKGFDINYEVSFNGDKWI